ncbi:hypothetical protein BCEP4_80014 [Burkholderia cepacia]|nr:hypothetical protein BCEP4_80014 [Burkholderia cepacia]
MAAPSRHIASRGGQVAHYAYPVLCMPVRHRTFTVPPFPAMAHKSRSHSNVGIFVHEAYHP